MTDDNTDFEFAGIAHHDPDAQETTVLYRRRLSDRKDEFRHVVIDSTTDARVIEYPKTPTESMSVTGGHVDTDEGRDD